MNKPQILRNVNWDSVAAATAVTLTDTSAVFSFPMDVVFDTRSHLFHTMRGALALKMDVPPIDLHICYATLMVSTELQVLRDLANGVFYHDSLFCFRHSTDAANVDRVLTLQRYPANSTYFRKRDPNGRNTHPID